MITIILIISSFVLGLIVGSKYILYRVQEQRKYGRLDEWLKWIMADDFNIFDWYRKRKQIGWKKLIEHYLILPLIGSLLGMWILALAITFTVGLFVELEWNCQLLCICYGISFVVMFLAQLRGNRN